MVAGRPYDPYDVGAHGRVDVHLLDDLLGDEELLLIDDLLDGLDRMLELQPFQHLDLRSLVGVTQNNPGEKAVELRLGKGKRPFVFDGVLRRDDDERRRQRIDLSVDRHLALFHALQQHALWVRGVPRLISSAKTTWAKIGPRRNSKVRETGSKTVTPITSDGNKSGVN